MNDILDTSHEGREINLDGIKAQLGDDINLLEIEPTLKKLMVAVGWDSNAFSSDAVDIDVSVFLLDHKDQTRENTDFVFYNNPLALDGAIKHAGDNRTGAGDGDDESVHLDLHHIPFDVVKIVFALSIYRGEEKEQGLGLIRNSYIRLVNMDDDNELLRFELDDHFHNLEETGVVVGSVNREGPKWHFTPLRELHQKGLAPIATQYGLNIIRQ